MPTACTSEVPKGSFMLLKFGCTCDSLGGLARTRVPMWLALAGPRPACPTSSGGWRCWPVIHALSGRGLEVTMQTLT